MTISDYLPKNAVIKDYNRDLVCCSVLYYLKNYIAGESRNLINSVMSGEDARQELTARVCYVVDYFYNKGMTDKTIKDLVNFSVRAVKNWIVNLKMHYSSRPDTSLNTDRLQEDCDKDDDNDSYGRISSIDDCSEEVMANDEANKFLLYLLTNGFTEEYVVLREVLFTSAPMMKAIRGEHNVRNVCKAFWISKEQTKIIEERIQILGVRFGFPIKKKLTRSYLLSNGIVS